MRIERVVLEHHGDVAVLGRDIGDVAVPDEDAAARDGLQPGEHAQGRGLAASRRTDEDEELTLGNFEIDGVDGRPGHPWVDQRGVLVRDWLRHGERDPPTGRYVPDDP